MTTKVYAITLYFKKKHYDRIKGQFDGQLNMLMRRWFGSHWRATHYDPEK